MAGGCQLKVVDILFCVSLLLYVVGMYCDSQNAWNRVMIDYKYAQNAPLFSGQIVYSQIGILRHARRAALSRKYFATHKRPRKVISRAELKSTFKILGHAKSISKQKAQIYQIYHLSVITILSGSKSMFAHTLPVT